MPVIIQDFEVVPEPPSRSAPNKSEASPATETAPTEFPDFEKLAGHWRERAERLRAH